MRDDEKNVTPEKDTPREPEVLQFYFTPLDEASEEEAEANPHAQSTTRIPEEIEALRDEFGEEVIWRVETYANEDTVFVDKARIVAVCQFLRAERGFNYFADLGGIDRFTEADRYEVFYNLVALDKQKRIRLKVRVDESDLTVPTVTDVYRAANWNERECWDMFGIRFKNHPDPRRMYMPEDFEYHPLRKEFPQLGVPGSLPLPPQTPEGDLTMDPFAAAHGSRPRKSYEEPRSDVDDE
jgi:NADH-quinone oxidoreductase subunit C